MIKISPTFHENFIFVKLSELPETQVQFLKRFIPGSHRQCVKINNELLKDCISYEDYEHCIQLIDNKHSDRYFDTQI